MLQFPIKFHNMKVLSTLFFLYLSIFQLIGQNFDYNSKWEIINNDIKSNKFEFVEKNALEILNNANKDENYYQSLKVIQLLQKNENNISQINRDFSFLNFLKNNISKSNNTIACVQKYILATVIDESYQNSSNLIQEAAMELQNRKLSNDVFADIFKSEIKHTTLFTFLIDKAILSYNNEIDFKQKVDIDQRLYNLDYFLTQKFDQSDILSKIFNLYQLGLSINENNVFEDYQFLNANRLNLLYEVDKNKLSDSYFAELQKIVTTKGILNVDNRILFNYLDNICFRGFYIKNEYQKLDTILDFLKQNLSDKDYLKFGKYQNYYKKDFNVTIPKSTYRKNEPIQIEAIQRGCKELKIKIFKSNNIINYLKGPEKKMDPNTYESIVDYNSIFNEQVVFDSTVRLQNNWLIDTMNIKLKGYNNGNYYIAFWFDDISKPIINRFYINNTFISNMTIDNKFKIREIYNGYPIPNAEAIILSKNNNEIEFVKKVKSDENGDFQTISEKDHYILQVEGNDTICNTNEYYSSLISKEEVIKNEISDKKYVEKFEMDLFVDKPYYNRGDSVFFCGNIYKSDTANILLRTPLKLYEFELKVANRNFFIKTDVNGNFYQNFLIPKEYQEIDYLEFESEFGNIRIPIRLKNNKYQFFLDSKNYSNDSNKIVLKGLITSKSQKTDFRQMDIYCKVLKKLYNDKSSVKKDTVWLEKRLSASLNGNFNLEFPNINYESSKNNEYQVFIYTETYNEYRNTKDIYTLSKKIIINPIKELIQLKIPEVIDKRELLPLSINLTENNKVIKSIISFDISELKIDKKYLINLYEPNVQIIKLADFKKLTNEETLNDNWLDKQLVNKKWLFEENIKDIYLKNIDISNWKPACYRISISAKDNNGNTYSLSKYFIIHDKENYPFLVNAKPLNVILEKENYEKKNFKVFFFSLYDSIYLDLFASMNSLENSKYIFLNKKYIWDIDLENNRKYLGLEISYNKNGNLDYYNYSIFPLKSLNNLIKYSYSNASFEIIHQEKNSSLSYLVSNKTAENGIDYKLNTNSNPYLILEENYLKNEVDNLINNSSTIELNNYQTGRINFRYDFDFDQGIVTRMEKISDLSEKETFLYTDLNLFQNYNYHNVMNEGKKLFDTIIINDSKSNLYGSRVDMMVNNNENFNVLSIEIPKIHCIVVEKNNNQLLLKKSEVLSYSQILKNMSDSDLDFDITYSIIDSYGNEKRIEKNETKLKLNKNSKIKLSKQFDTKDYSPGAYKIQVKLKSTGCSEVIEDEIFIK